MGGGALDFGDGPQALPPEVTGPAGENPPYHQATQDTPTGNVIPGPMLKGRGLPGGSTGEKAADFAASAIPAGLGKAPAAISGGYGLAKAGAQGGMDAFNAFAENHPTAGKVLKMIGYGLVNQGIGAAADTFLPPPISHAVKKLGDFWEEWKTFNQIADHGAGAKPPTQAAPPASSAAPEAPPQWSEGVGPGRSTMHARGGSAGHACSYEKAQLRTLQRAARGGQIRTPRQATRR